MAEDTRDQFQAQQQQAVEEQRREESAAGTALCKYCGTALDLNLGFCTECGAKIGGEERICVFCQTATASDFCPHCGKRVVPHICPKCGNETIFDACEKCGALLNPDLEAFMTLEAPEPQVMTKEEVKQAEKSFRQEASPEFEAFQNKLIDRQILVGRAGLFQ